MEKKDNYISQELFDISIEDFDALDGVHEFSDKYKNNKKELIKEYRKSVCNSSFKKYKKAAAAAAVLLIISVPVITNAATGGEFFNRIWGNEGKGVEYGEPYSEYLYDDEKGTSCKITYPKSEYENTDPEKAEELIGDNISYNPVDLKIGDTKLSVLSFVHDGNAAVAEFTLEKKGGVDVLEYNKSYNRSKGAAFSGNAKFYFNFDEYDGKIFVDIDKSSKDKVYCYYYMTCQYQENTDSVTLNIEEYPCTNDELYAAEGIQYEKYISEIKYNSVPVPVSDKAEKTVFTNAKNGIAEVSPLSVKIDMKKGLGLYNDEAYDPYSAYYVSINYKNGKKYIVHEHEMDGIHQCGTEIDNTSYACGDIDGNFTLVFNRLVDTDNIQSVTVNETEYILK